MRAGGGFICLAGPELVPLATGLPDDQIVVFVRHGTESIGTDAVQKSVLHERDSQQTFCDLLLLRKLAF